MRTKQQGRGQSLSWMNVNDDNDLYHQSCLTQAVKMACTHGLVMCHCDIVVVVGVCHSGHRQSNNGCEVVMVVAEVTEGCGCNDGGG